MIRNEDFKKGLSSVILSERFIYPFVVLGLSLVYYLSYANYGIIEGDWGSILVGAKHFLQGKVFYRDFSIIYTPGIYIYTAIFFKLLGISLSSATLGWSILRVLNCFIIYLIGIEFVSRRMALILPFLLWFVPGTLHKSFFVFFLLLDMLLLIKMLSLKSRLFYFVSGIIAGITLLFRIDLFGFFIITFVSVEFLKLISSDKKSSGLAIINLSLKNVVLFSCGIMAGVGPFIFYLVYNSALIDAYQQTREYSAAMKSLWLALPPVSEMFSMNILAIHKYIGAFVPILLYFFVLVIIGLILKQGDYRPLGEKDKKFFTTLLFGSMTINQALMYPNIARIGVILSPLLIISLYLIVRYSNRKDNYSKKTRLIYLISLAGLTLTLLSYIVLSCMTSDVFINGSYLIRSSNTYFMSEPRLRVYTTPEYAKNFKKIKNILIALTEEEEYIFNFPASYQMYHFVTNRKAIEKYSLIGEYMGSEKRQKEVIKQLEEKDVRVIIAVLELERQKREVWAPILNKYIMKHYEPMHTIGSFSILVRRRDLL